MGQSALLGKLVGLILAFDFYVGINFPLEINP